MIAVGAGPAGFLWQMVGDLPLSFDSVWLLCVALGLAALAALIAVLRRPPTPRLTLAFGAIGLVLLALGAGELTWERASTQAVVVMVDLSPSTRAADYRDSSFLVRRIHDLLDGTPYVLRFFAAGSVEVPPTTERLADIPVEQTRYDPPAAGAVLLFSDCRFPIPQQSPPTYVVVDGGLEDVEDASVADVEIRGDEMAVKVKNGDSTRQLVLRGATGASPTTVPSGEMVVMRSIVPGAARVSAELSPGDAWPENDALSAVLPPPDQFDRWWVGGAGHAPGWRTLPPEELPTESAAYLAPAVIVLEDVSAAELTDEQRQRLQEYVRDLGGGLVILGGDHAFAAGEYEGTALEALSPLASSPPSPTTHWVFLADASGSMSAQAAGATRWKIVADALVRVLSHLPPQDVVSVGSFAERLEWWTDGRSVRDAQATPLPPASAYPHGPTNLQPALEAIARSVESKMPIQLLVLSDFDTQITRADLLAEQLESKGVHVNLLAIGEGAALAAMREIAAATGGTVIERTDPQQWADAAHELTRTAMPGLLQHQSLTFTFGPQVNIAAQTTSVWNRTWIKNSASRLAEAQFDRDSIPMSARWNVGEGQVLSAAFDPPPAVATRLAELVARPPHDPRFHVTWHTGSMLRVTVDATTNDDYINGERLTLKLSDGAKTVAMPVPQTGPGRYEVSTVASRSPCVATVRVNQQVVSRTAVAGRYAREFDALGNDHRAMEELARLSGGRVIAPDFARPVDIHWPRRPLPLSSWLAAVGALFIGLALVWWRLR